VPMASGRPPHRLSFFFSFAPQDGYNIQFNIYIYIYKDVGKLVSLHP
jgi:hypothetical protein